MGLNPDRKVAFLPRRARHGRHERWRAAVAELNARLAELERRFGTLDTASSAIKLGPRMRTALFASVMVHLAIIFGIGFPLPKKPDQPPSLDVVLVNARSKAPPEVADAQAQHNLDGGGNTDEKRRAQSPLPVLPDQKPDADVKLALRRVEQLEREVRQVMTQAKAPTPPVETAPPAKAAPAPEPEAKPDPQTTEILQRSLEIARLEAKISKDWDAYQQRPRRHYIGARTQEYRFARYVEDWRQKIERVGDMNYPQAARDQRLHGSLLVTVGINANGTVEEVSINRPSGHRILDEAARRIVNLAAPFAAFPPDIAKDVDILYITRTWTFTPGDTFRSSQ